MIPRIALVSLLGLALAGCVTERREPGLTRRDRPVPARAGGAPSLPPGPLAEPVVDASFSSGIRFELIPLGTMKYDGQVLPLFSPDGRFAAAQEGSAPSWATLLGGPGATVPASTRLAVLDLSARPIRVVPPAQERERGLLLGRACDDGGFLVEAPRPDGSRWIGRISWATGALEWLVQGPRVNAHAVLTPGGSLAWVSRDIADSAGSLILRAHDGVETARSVDGVSHLFPVASPEPGIVCSLAETTAGLELLAYSLDTDGPDAPERLGSIVTRVPISAGAGAALAYQAVAASPAVLPARAGAAWKGQGPAIFHPGLGRMAEFDRQVAGLRLLPEGSIAAARGDGMGAPGWFVATPRGLVFQPDAARDPSTGEREATHEARVLAEPFVPRSTTDPDRPIMLLGPVTGDPLRLRVMALRPAK